MRQKKVKRMMKVGATTIVSLGLLINMSGPTITNAEDQLNSIAENSSQIQDEDQINQLLKKLTPKQKKYLKELEMQDYPVISPELNLSSPEIVNVIIEFKQAPAKVEVLKQAIKGNKISLSEARTKAEANHSAFKAEFEKQKNEKKLKNAKINREYRDAFNGVSMELPANEVRDLLRSGVVQRIWKSEEVQLELPPESNEIQLTNPAKVNESLPQIGADKLHQENITGKGIKVGVIDTGVDYNHPDLKDAFKGGYDFVDMDANPMEASYTDWEKAGKRGPVASYVTSHGTHVSGTIVGKKKNNVEYAVEGVAPEADLYVYRVLGPGGTGTTANVIAGIDRAVSDQMDVINLSLGTNINNALDPAAVAVNNAMLSGVVTVVSAGNSGPGEKTLGTPGAAALPITVGASDVTQTIPTLTGSVGLEKFPDLKLLAKNFTDRIENLNPLYSYIVDVGLGRPSDFTNKNVKDRVVLIERGTISLNEKIENAKKAGAKAVIIYNNEDGHIPYYLGESTTFLPTFSMTKAEGERCKKLIPIPSAFKFDSLGSTTIEGDHLADFSSRGPVENNFDIKPDVVAPGVAIFSTIPEFINDPQAGEKYEISYGRKNGTSMASPHVAGAAALMLQAHPDYTPFDVKTALMNTADDLKENYSVNEVGAGRINVYEAAHAGALVKVMDKTAHIQNGKTIEIDEQTGSISYGAHYREGKEIQDSRKVVIQNKTQDQNKSFNIQIEYGPAKGLIQDNAQNGVWVEAPATLTVAAGQSAEFQPVIHVPTSAKAGRYEGYIHLTNQQNPAENYQVPFSIRISERGIDTFTATRVAITNTFKNTFASSDTHGYIRLLSPLKTLDLILKDAKTGKPIAYAGTFNVSGMPVDKTYYIPYMFDGKGYLFTDDPHYPIAEKETKLPEGDYLLEMIGTDDQEKTYKKETIMIIDNTPPKVTLDRKPGVYEVKESMYTNENNYNAVWTHGNITDSTIDLLKSKGFNVNQGYNSMLWYEYSVYAYSQLVLDEDGNFEFPAGKDRITDMTWLNTIINPVDYATMGYGEQKYWFIKEGTQYGLANYSKDELYLGDEVTMTLSLKNVQQLVSGELQFPFNMNYFKFENAKINEKFLQYTEQKGAQVQMADPVFVTQPWNPSTSTLKLGVTIDQQDFKTDQDLPFIDVTFSLINDNYYANEFPFDNFTISYKESPTAQLTTLRSFHGNPFQIMPKTSVVTAQIYPEAFMNERGWFDSNMDLSKIGAKAYVKTANGEIYSGTIDKYGSMMIAGVPASNTDYDIYVEVPGHLKSKITTNVSNNVNGKWIGGKGVLDLYKNYAGELTDDNIVDIRDINQVVLHYGDQGGKEDINQDGIVNEKDVRLVEKNFLRKGPDANPNAEAKETIGKKGLADFLHDIGLEPMN
jgi:subtilisin family serine protease